MKRRVPFLALLALACSSTPQARAQTAAGHVPTLAEFAQTAAYAAAHQNADGGFAAGPGQPSTLGATNTGLRVLEYVGGSIPDVAACIKFVKSCKVPGSGFAQTPGGKPDVTTTAIGLMAAGELKIADKAMIDDAIAYFGANSKAFEEVRMSIAGLEAVESKSPDFARWAAQIEGMRQPDGSFGEGPAKAFATGGAAAAILRMGLPLEKREAVIAAIKAGQRPDGAWSKDAGPSDLSSSYRVMRCLYMLKEKPDAAKLREYIAKLPPARRQLFRRARRQGEPRRDVLRRDHPPLAPPARRRAAGPRADRLHPALRRQGPRGLGGEHVALVGPRRHARGQVARASTTTSSWPRGRATATSSSRSGSGSRTARATAASSSAASACPAPRCRATRPTSARTTGAASTTSRGATRSWSRPRPRPSRRSRRTAGTTTSSAPWGTGSRLYLNGVPSVVYREEDPGISRDGQIAVQIHAGAPMEVQFKDLQIRLLP